MWDKIGFTTPMQGCSPLLSQYHNGLFHKKNRVGVEGEVEDILFENPLEPLGFCFTPKFQTK